MNNMIRTGSELRIMREALGISQARLSEIFKLPQHILSSFELEKSELPHEKFLKLNELLNNIKDYESIIKRKKRYREHTYDKRKIDPTRLKKYSKGSGNTQYLAALADLQVKPPPSFTALSLFSGIGGFSLGFRRCGFDIKGFVEIDDGLSKIYEKNFPNTPRIGADITQIPSNLIKDFSVNSGPIDVVIGGPPCQGFSLSGKRQIDDPRNYLFEDYLRVIDIIAPRIAIVENVKLLTSMRSKEGGMVKDDMQEGFRKHGYKVKYFEINAIDYGVPQHRERVFFIATRNDLNIEPSFSPASFGGCNDFFSNINYIRTFADACSDLPYIESGQTSNDPWHFAVNHPDHVIDWLWDVPQGVSAHDNTNPDLRPPSGYNTTYKRQIWNEPSSTVQTTFGMISGCRNVHPIATRSLTIREAARLQSFPDDYEFSGLLSTIRTGIGNAVPPVLAFSIAEHVVSLLRDLIEVPCLKVEL